MAPEGTERPMLVKAPRSRAVLLATTPTAPWLKCMDLVGPILEHQLSFSERLDTVSYVPGTGIRWNEDAVARHLT